MTDGSLVARVAAGAVASIGGIWQRHVSVRYAEEVFEGRQGYGRWGTEHGFPVLYLGRPTASVIVEAYRHLVDPVEDPAVRLAVKPRVLVTCSVRVDNVLDLRSARTRVQVGLTQEDLLSDTTDEAAYARCQEVAAVAHGLGRHGVIAPAATRLGETLALFVDLLPATQRPVRTADDLVWAQLPPDPRARRRTLRVVRDSDMP